MAKVTYLFGAGASCHCLPMVCDVPKTLKNLNDLVGKHKTGLSQKRFENLSCDFTYTQAEDEILNEVSDLIRNVKNHASIDTYAKKLYITGGHEKKKYKILKTLLSLSFIYAQLRQAPDHRYDTFFASILGDSDSEFLYGNIKVISWNYDFQFEKAFSSYSQSSSLKQNQDKLKVYPPLSYHGHDDDTFSILKINGTTGFLEVGSESAIVDPIDEIMDAKYEQVHEKFLWYYAASVYDSSKARPSLSFAWEENNKFNKMLLENADRAIQRTDVLVVIGYSFPFFNRVIDKKLLKAMNPKKIYVQDPNPKPVISNLITVLDPNFNTNYIIPIDNVDQFYLPAEL